MLGLKRHHEQISCNRLWYFVFKDISVPSSGWGGITIVLISVANRFGLSVRGWRYGYIELWLGIRSKRSEQRSHVEKQDNQIS
ncbi:hypothetical protein V6N11_006558 [Hibiscus sabdariffa]|uniref:Uncharacterized protein n=1 Tax=Hibiscus sabdariffa TaxID=183260 RepID=A0ABR2RR98_9ROSI